VAGRSIEIVKINVPMMVLLIFNFLLIVLKVIGYTCPSKEAALVAVRPNLVVAHNTGFSVKEIRVEAAFYTIGVFSIRF
jgi:hypothetical protein